MQFPRDTFTDVLTANEEYAKRHHGGYLGDKSRAQSGEN